MNKLFDSWTWNINLSGLGGNKTKKYTSTYSTGLATIHEPTLKAIMLYVAAVVGQESKTKIAIGTNGDNIVSETVKDNVTTYVVFNKSSRRFLACDIEADTIKPYIIAKGYHTSTALIMTLIPELMLDVEFEAHINSLIGLTNEKETIEDVFSRFDGDEELQKDLYVLCDNVYRQIQKDICSCVVPSSGNIVPITELALQSGIYQPTDVIIGTFTKGTVEPAKNINPDDFKTDYILDENREYSEFEKSLIPELPDWYVVPKYLANACKMITANLSRKVRNILLRGEAGTGKTESAKAMASALRLPYVSICCHPDMMITDFTGTILPKLNSDSSVTTEELPSFEDIEMDASYAYYKLTGKEAPKEITGNDVFNMLLKKVSESASANGNNSLQYEYCDSPLIRAIRYGWLCEIQEPSIIERPGVLVGLNSLLDTCESVTLPTGEVIKRHPDCVIVITTNVTYQGCKDINNSVLSRMQFKCDTELPTDTELIERIENITGFNDEKTLSEMIKVVSEMHTFCNERMISDGCCGVRELIDWVQAYQTLGSVLEAAECTIIPSASADSENQHEIKIACLLPHFAA